MGGKFSTKTKNVWGVTIADAGTVICNSVELTNISVRKVLGKLMPTLDAEVKPVPLIVRVNAELPEAMDEGLRLVIVSGVLVVLKFAYTIDSSVGAKVSGLVVPARSKVQPENTHWPDGLVVAGVAV